MENLRKENVKSLTWNNVRKRKKIILSLYKPTLAYVSTHQIT